MHDYSPPTCGWLTCPAAVNRTSSKASPRPSVASPTTAALGALFGSVTRLAVMPAGYPPPLPGSAFPRLALSRDQRVGDNHDQLPLGIGPIGQDDRSR